MVAFRFYGPSFALGMLVSFVLYGASAWWLLLAPMFLIFVPALNINLSSGHDGREGRAMAEDIVDRLRLDEMQFKLGKRLVHNEYYERDVRDAAEEIERLRSGVDALVVQRFADGKRLGVLETIARAEAAEASLAQVTKERDEARAALYVIANIGATATAFTLSRNLRLAEDTARAALNPKDHA